MKSIQIPEDLKKVNAIFSRAGFKAYLVGGAVRDLLMGKKNHDWDLATNATPQQVMSIFHKVIPTGIAHGTVTIHIFGLELETTTFRTEGKYTDGRHPDSIEYAATIEEDLSRRDFTMNAIAADLGTGEIIDPFDGQKDIKERIIRTVGSPLDRFNEDGLRPVRAVRFASKLGFRIEESTLKALSESEVLEKTASISVERFRDEFCKILQTPKPSIGLKLLEETGIMDLFIPEFKVCRGCRQQDYRGFHEFDVADHIIYAVDGAPEDNLTVRLAAFYHDIGKPESKTTETVDGKEQIHFHGHESISASKALKSMTSLKFSNEEIKKVCHLVKEHMFYYESSWSDAAVRRFMIRIGMENFRDLIDLRKADVYGMHDTPMTATSPAALSLFELEERIRKIEEQKSALSLKDMAVNGRDLMEAGIPSGKVLGQILKDLFEAITESPAMNNRDDLINLARNLYEKRYNRI